MFILKIFSSLLVFVFLFLGLPISLYAQVGELDQKFDFERAYQDYVFTFDVYNSKHAEYILSKAQYEQAKTLFSQSKARESALNMLAARDDVVITYLTAVRMRMVEAEGVSDTVKQGLFSRLDAEVAWFKDHKARLSSSGTLKDIEEDSAEAANRFSRVSQTIAYETLATIPFGTLSLLRQETSNILKEINEKIYQLRISGDKDTSKLERWAFEVDNKITRSLDKEIEAQSLIINFVPRDRQRNTDYFQNFSRLISNLDESRQLLRDAIGPMKEIIRNITTF